jgi:hypothetical protein
MEEQIKKEAEIQSQIYDRYQQEETFWKQKSRITWLKNGERNTTFFHHSTIQHRMHNRTNSLKKTVGARVETHKEINQ